MTDDQLRDQLERRSKLATHSADWARHDLLPTVNAAIDTRPYRVTTSRAPAFAGLAAAVAIVVVLVVAMPRLGPGSGSPPPTQPAPPSTISALGTAEFATRLASGELNGQTLLVIGEIIRARGGIAEPCLPPGPCLIGVMAGFEPRPSPGVYANYVETTEGTDASAGTPGLPWEFWHLAPVPLKGVLVLSIDSEGGIEFIGRNPPDEIASSLSEIPSIDLESMPLEEIRVVSGWLAGIDAPLPCPEPPPDSEITALPGRYCGDSSWLTPEKVRFDPYAMDAPRGSLHVQSGAYMQFAQNPVLTEGLAEPRSGAYVIARRLEGRGCPNGRPPCWQWEVVGRLTMIGDGSVAAPLETTSPSLAPASVQMQQTNVGTFVLSAFVGAATYASNQSIDIHAELLYNGPTESVVVATVGNVVNGFGVRQLDGPYSMGPGWNEPCIPDSLDSGVARVEPFRKSGGYSQDDPNRNFYIQYFADPELRLPEGTWEVTAYSEFWAGPCSGDLVDLEASVVIEVHDPN